MKTVFILLLFFLGVGVFARSYNRKANMWLVLGIAAMLLYLYLA